MSTRISISDLTKRFGEASSPAAAVAVDRVTLDIEPGELFFLLGPSGCGKTTLLRMIAGFIEPTGGRILFTNAAGQTSDVTFLPPNKRNTGMVFQSYALWPHMTVAQNVAFGLDIRKVREPERARRVAEALEAVQMGPYAARKPNQLSGGQQQRVALARALVVRPDVLLLDEPLSNLDAKLRTELRSQIRGICKSAGITSVYVTHDQKEALSMADRIAVMEKGRMVQVGAPGDLYRRPASRFVAEFLGETNFLPGKLVGHAGDTVTVQTPAGKLSSTHVEPALAAAERAGGENGRSADLLCSIRPEAFRIGAPDGRNTLFGRVIESTYLGETAQLIAELPGEVRVKVAQLNPPGVPAAGAAASHDNITLAVNPDDVVLVPQ